MDSARTGPSPGEAAEAARDQARRPGRPRREATQAEALDVALKLLEERGYAAMTVDEVAERAGVGKQTLYRRWPSKAALALTALSRRTAREVAAPDSGSLREDLRLLLSSAFAALRAKWAPVVTSLMAEAQRDDTFAAEFRESFVAPRRAVLEGLLQRARERGEIGAHADVGLLIDLVYGAMWYRLLNRHAPLDDDFAKRLSDAAMAAASSH